VHSRFGVQYLDYQLESPLPTISAKLEHPTEHNQGNIFHNSDAATKRQDKETKRKAEEAKRQLKDAAERQQREMVREY